MEPILSKREISSLLDAIRAGEIPLDNEQDTVSNFIPCSPVNLFDIVQPKDELGRIPNIDIIYDNFCRDYSISLTNQLQRTFNIKRIALETITYQDYLAKRKNPGAIGLINLQPLLHSAVLVYDHRLAFSMIEIMLGASNELDTLHINRSLTTIELTILKTALSEACSILNKVFKPLINLEASLAKVENNSRLVSITEPESEVLVGTFLVQVDDLSGEIDLVIPAMTLDPLQDKLRELLMVDVTTRDTWRETLEEQLNNTTLEIIARSGSITMPVQNILKLNEGDIIPISYDPNSPLEILIEDQLKFFAKPGVTKGKKAIGITSVYQQGE